MTTAPIAVASDVKVIRGGRTILNGVSLALDGGTITVLLGPNGAGKTTLVKAFCGNVPVAQGTVAVCGRDPRRDRTARAAIGFVPQEIALYPRLSVRENVETFAALSGRTGLDRRRETEAALDSTGLGAVAGRPASLLSGGMQRRTNLACALIGGPKLLLLDEPAVGLDLEARLDMGSLLRRLADTAGCAVLITTHHVAEAEALADRAVVVDAGLVIAAGAPKDLIDRNFPAATRRVEAVLTEPASDALGADFARHGFVPTPDRLIWQSLSAASLDRSLAMLDGVGTRHGTLHEVRVRRPGLEDVYLKLLSREAAA